MMKYTNNWQQESEGFTYAVKNGKLGYFNNDGEVVIPFIYDKIRRFNSGIAFAKKDGKWGVIDKQGKELLPFKYNYDSVGEFDNGVAWVSNEKILGSLWMGNGHI